MTKPQTTSNPDNNGVVPMQNDGKIPQLNVSANEANSMIQQQSLNTTPPVG